MGTPHTAGLGLLNRPHCVPKTVRCSHSTPLEKGPHHPILCVPQEGRDLGTPQTGAFQAGTTHHSDHLAQTLTGRASPRLNLGIPGLGWGTSKVSGPQMRRTSDKWLQVSTSAFPFPRPHCKNSREDPLAECSQSHRVRAVVGAVLGSPTFQREPGAGQSSKPRRSLPG